MANITIGTIQLRRILTSKKSFTETMKSIEKNWDDYYTGKKSSKDAGGATRNIYLLEGEAMFVSCMSPEALAQETLPEHPDQFFMIIGRSLVTNSAYATNTREYYGTTNTFKPIIVPLMTNIDVDSETTDITELNDLYTAAISKYFTSKKADTYLAQYLNNGEYYEVPVSLIDVEGNQVEEGEKLSQKAVNDFMFTYMNNSMSWQY